MGLCLSYFSKTFSFGRIQITIYLAIMKLSKELATQLKEKYNAEGTTLRLAQLRMLEMLKFIDDICRTHNLVYWLEGGTLLGAIRHGGFIPWDDDVDICMPHKDAERFKQIMLNEIKSNKYVLQCKETDKGYFGAWYILRDMNSEYIQNSLLHKRREYKGLQVDIFIAEDHINAPFWNISLFIQKCIDKILNKIKNDHLACILARPLYYAMHNVLIPLFRHISKEKNYYKMPYGSIWKYKLLKNHIYPIRNCTFEDSEFYCPGDFDAYLTTQYGNWQDVPNNIWTHQAEIIIK